MYNLLLRSNELTKFHYAVSLVNVDNAAMKAAEDKKNIDELTRTFRTITLRDNHAKSLFEKLKYKANEVNNNSKFS